MSFFSTLLTVGSTVGRICETLVASPVLTDNETGVSVTLSSLNLGGVSFFQSNAESQNGEMKTYVANCNSNGMQSVAFPNIGSEGGSVSLLLKPLDKKPIDNFFTENVPEETNVIVGPAEDATNAKKNPFDGAVRVYGAHIRIGEHFQLGFYGGHISNRVIYVTVAAGAGIALVTGLSLIIFRRSGNEVIDPELHPAVIVPNGHEKTAGADMVTYKFDIDLGKYGLKEKDMLDEVILTLKVDNIETLCDAQDNSKITPVELKLLRQLEDDLKNKR